MCWAIEQLLLVAAAASTNFGTDSLMSVGNLRKAAVTAAAAVSVVTADAAVVVAVVVADHRH